ncbi:hypothetical protein [Streptosporangium roseum]
MIAAWPCAALTCTGTGGVGGRERLGRLLDETFAAVPGGINLAI